MYFVYLIESLKDGRYYIGQTNNLEERLKYHNNNRCKYTKMKGPWILKGYRSFSTRAEAMKEERRLKQFKNRYAIEEYFKTEA
jgi:putative endonuclease